jgi:hypothetical protein
MYGILEIIVIYLYLLSMNNVVIKKKVNENTRNTARTIYMKKYTKWNNCIMLIDA